MSDETTLTCDNCGTETDVLVSAPEPRCPSCAPSATGRRDEVKVVDGDRVLVTTIHRVGMRWDALREMVIADSREPEARPVPWWRRILRRSPG